MFAANSYDILVKLLVVSTFCSSIVIETGLADVYLGYLVLAVGACLWAMRLFPLPKFFLVICVGLILHLALSAVLRAEMGFDASVLAGLRQLIGIVFVYGVVFFLLARSTLNASDVHRYYLRVGILFCWIGLVIYLSALVWPQILGGIASVLPKWIGDRPTSIGIPRFVSLANEASFALILLSPLVIEAAGRFVGTARGLKSYESFLVLVSSILTLSPLVMVVWAFGLTYWFFVRQSVRVIPIGILTISAFLILIQVPGIEERTTILGTGVELAEVENISAFTLLNNAQVAREAFLNSYGLGFGLGSHETSFERYSFPTSDDLFRLNAKDANSLLLRVLSEIGVLGILAAVLALALLLLFASRRLVDRSIAGALAIVLILHLIRWGHYFQLVLVVYAALIVRDLRDHKQAARQSA